jgi:hypothetical protein
MPNPGDHSWFERLEMDYGCKSVGRLSQQNLNVADGAFPETTFAIAEVKLPCADKFVIKSEISDLVDLIPESLPPMRKRLRVVGRNVFKLGKPETARSPDRSTYFAD